MPKTSEKTQSSKTAMWKLVKIVKKLQMIIKKKELIKELKSLSMHLSVSAVKKTTE